MTAALAYVLRFVCWSSLLLGSFSFLSRRRLTLRFSEAAIYYYRLAFIISNSTYSAWKQGNMLPQHIIIALL